MSSTNIASGLLNRNISAATGVSARTEPASNPAGAPNQRRTVRYRTPTDPTPMSAWGTRIDQLLTPKIRALITIGQRNSGDLSTVIELAESSDPKNIAFQLWFPPGPRPSSSRSPNLRRRGPRGTAGGPGQQRDEGRANPCRVALPPPEQRCGEPGT